MDIHHGIICDACESDPIRGLRFKCLECPDFDICEECYNKEFHKEHKMERKTAQGKGQQFYFINLTFKNILR